MKSKYNVLILTATITPPSNAAKLSRVDPAERLRDYQGALSFYIERLKLGEIDCIVFADNSASDVTSLRALAEASGVADRIEFIVFEGLDYPPEYGRGYGEFKLIDYVMLHSRLIARAPKELRVWKITGRYILRNLGAVVKSMPADADIYCHCRNIPMRWADLYVMGWRMKGYENLLRNIYVDLREDSGAVSAESIFRARLDSGNPGLKVAPRFKVLCQLEGYRGYDNKSYSDFGLKYKVRKWSNWILPWLWI